MTEQNKEQEIRALLEAQKVYYASGVTLTEDFRRSMLEKLYNAIHSHQTELCGALQQDLGKSAHESYLSEIGTTLSEISFMQSHLHSLMKKKRVPTPLAQFAAHSYISPSPLGNVLIISPWNYPVLLTLSPLANSIAAGNTAILKPSAYAPSVSAVLKKLIESAFPKEYAAVITGGREENQALLRQKFDLFFFTGGKTVAKEVMRAAAEHLSPMVLELGGKTPCIVDSTAKLKLAARRIVFGKFLNCGQTCIAPDYILVEEPVREELIAHIKAEITAQYGADLLQNPNYGKIINQKHFERLCALIDSTKLVHGGQQDPQTLRIAPTVLDGVSWEDAVMGEEIFGPILPILSIKNIEEAIATVNAQPHPLALYLFSESKEQQQKVMQRCRFGGGCINDTVIHIATSAMPFGGVGESGMGCYHGKKGFETFSHYRSIVDKKTFLDLPIRYQPYTKLKRRLISFFLK